MADALVQLGQDVIKSLARRLVVCVILASVMGAGLVGWLSWLGNPTDSATERAVTAAAMGAAMVLVGGLLGVIALVAVAAGSMNKLGIGVMASASVRLLVAVFLGFAVFTLAGPEKKPFWFALLVAGLVSLVLETLLTLKALPRRPLSSTTEVSR